MQVGLTHFNMATFFGDGDPSCNAQVRARACACRLRVRVTRSLLGPTFQRTELGAVTETLRVCADRSKHFQLD